jgi:hypothetical protein
MIAVPTMQHAAPRVAQKRHFGLRDSDAFRESAAREFAAGLEGVTVKQARRAGVPGADPFFLSRAKNGDSSNPLFRLASIFVLGRILGVPKSRFQRWIDLLQEWLDKAYDEAPKPSLEDVLKKDSELDVRDDHLRFRVATGDPAAKALLVEETRVIYAHKRTLLLALEQG